MAGAGEGSIANNSVTSDSRSRDVFGARAALNPPAVGRQNAPERENGPGLRGLRISGRMRQYAGNALVLRIIRFNTNYTC